MPTVDISQSFKTLRKLLLKQESHKIPSLSEIFDRDKQDPLWWKKDIAKSLEKWTLINDEKKFVFFGVDLNHIKEFMDKIGRKFYLDIYQGFDIVSGYITNSDRKEIIRLLLPVEPRLMFVEEDKVTVFEEKRSDNGRTYFCQTRTLLSNLKQEKPKLIKTGTPEWSDGPNNTVVWQVK
jgi:hypothetical protein